MIAYAPLLLALLGTALMALVIFAPAIEPAPAGDATRAAVSFSPPVFEPPVYAPPACAPPAFAEPAWPALIDPRAAACDAASRLALVDALAAVRRPWADAILARAAADETDPRVREAIDRASRFGDAARPDGLGGHGRV